MNFNIFKRREYWLAYNQSLQLLPNFTYKQLIVSIRAIILVSYSFYIANINIDAFYLDIHTTLLNNLISIKHISMPKDYWSINSFSLLYHDNKIFILSFSNLWNHTL